MQTLNRYRALHKPNQLLYGTGGIVIITGWTPKERVAKLLDETQYAAIGNLYSPAGVDILVRNLLHNPHVTGLIIIEATTQDKNSGAITHLLKFLVNQAEVGEDIAPDDIQRIRTLNWEVWQSVDQSVDQDWLTAQCEVLSSSEPLGGNRKTYPMPEIDSPTVPSPLYGHRVEAQTIAETWVKILHRIRSGGVLRPTGYDGQWQELIDLMAVVTDEPTPFYFPDPNYLPCDRAFVNNYIPSILEDAPADAIKYTYGSRLRSHFGCDQIEQVVYKLAGEIDAASAVMSLWDVQDHVKGGSPCLNQIWVRIVNQELSLTAVLRSNDMFNAWPINAFGLRALQMYVRDRVCAEAGTKLDLGPLITLSQSAHLYDHSFAYADETIANHYGKSPKSYSDPVGNYLVELLDGQIHITRMNGLGKPIREYTGRNVRNLMDAIALDAPAMQPDHAMYLGVQINNAWNCLRFGEKFTQD